jgi:hypothetical protein
MWRKSPAPCLALPSRHLTASLGNASLGSVLLCFALLCYALLSFAGRKPKKPIEKRPQNSNRGIWKDNQLDRVFWPNPQERQFLLDTLNADVKFLAGTYAYRVLCASAEKYKDMKIIDL